MFKNCNSIYQHLDVRDIIRRSLQNKFLPFKTVFIRIMEVQCKYAKNNFCLNFRNPLWESSSEAERKREREERFLKGERDNWGLERERDKKQESGQ